MLLKLVQRALFLDFFGKDFRTRTEFHSLIKAVVDKSSFQTKRVEFVMSVRLGLNMQKRFCGKRCCTRGHSLRFSNGNCRASQQEWLGPKWKLEPRGGLATGVAKLALTTVDLDGLGGQRLL